MAIDSKIQWTEHTWNPFIGCKKISPGCKFCYMYRDQERYGQDGSYIRRASDATFNKPLHWKEPAKVFTCSWSDWFIEDADEWRDDAWAIIKKTPHLTYQILTKRPERIKQCLPDDWGEGYPNVWLGVSVESVLQTHRINDLKKIPAKIKFISAEPLIGSLYDSVTMNILSSIIFNNSDIQWMIIGGESGNDTGKYKYRPCKLVWINEIIQFCRHKEIPVFVKQLGTDLSKKLDLKDRHGGDMDEWPSHLQVRQFPE